MARLTALRLTAGAVVLGISPGASAYLDPGTGSMLLQFLIAGVLGALFTIKMYWHRLKVFFARLMGKEKKDPRPADDADRHDRSGAPD